MSCDLSACVAVDHLDGPLLLGRVQGGAGLEQDLRPAQRLRSTESAVSCESVARNSSLTRVARCAAIRALRSASKISSRCCVGKLDGLDPLGRGQIAGELGVAEQSAGVVAKGGDSDIGPKRRTVLAQAPAGIDKAALFRGHLQLVLGPPLSRTSSG